MIATPDRTPLPRAFFDRPVLEVAPDLLGRVVLRTTPDGPIALRLTEVEAYDGPNDPGSHAYRGPTARNGVMFGPPGHVYVYFTYGMWHCMNLVCGPEGRASGVLLRAGEIVEGAELARKRRASACNDRELAKGPARLATALDVDRSLDGVDACTTGDQPLTVLEGAPVDPALVRSGPRTGVAGEGGVHPWRFWVADDPTVSPYRAHAPRRRRS
ncbi:MULTISPECIES: DNA-3-methyladenine glycosylase [Streptomyces]|uniref:Putative 3-methyladenine DNA glycosylase n=1 Tax=Streptomyces griseoaurantiacus TaxID=68213 RepID=A0A7W2DSA0_9ACTN|nr:MULTISPECIES: DNA-3-methyladenine glycosylase [Streptomyces]MBA5222074.1 DNA-3-methyladenine glycosylase [Streptomyces griseoaurantiacus]MCF0090462.1 putative 3-methyladenine DNA glycosylase [Streptomyces sp. MH192]MCF0102795.1 putative 3-methyladenine DNA glycosylase [Streptomyces sp. MH191]MDX3360327.1 DNA-3-methyladenine glycosylase [Streptomyces sp. ME02-6978.2a]GHE51819.1 putative 3-methyladenine DNA glycosylase [Streptomyces griseoaurantiacus]